MKLLLSLTMALVLLLISCRGEESTSNVQEIAKDGVALSITLPEGWHADLSEASPSPELIETLLYAMKAGEGGVSLHYDPEPLLPNNSPLSEMRNVLDAYGDALEGHRMKGLERTKTTLLGEYPAELFVVPYATEGEAKLTHQVAFVAENRMWILNCIEQKGIGLCGDVVSSVN